MGMAFVLGLCVVAQPVADCFAPRPRVAFVSWVVPGAFYCRTGGVRNRVRLVPDSRLGAQHGGSAGSASAQCKGRRVRRVDGCGCGFRIFCVWCLCSCLGARLEARRPVEAVEFLGACARRAAVNAWAAEGLSVAGAPLKIAHLRERKRGGQRYGKGWSKSPI